MVLAVLVAAWFVVAPGSALAQRQTINVLVDARYRATGQRFIDDMKSRLDPAALEKLAFETRFVTPPEIQPALQAKSWEMR